jgi:hypothetical protein
MLELERILVIEAIRDLKARYCRLADQKQWDQFGRLFAPDAKARFLGPDGTVRIEIEGDRAIAETIGSRVGDNLPVHHVFSAEFDIQSDTEARATWAMEDWMFQPDGKEAEWRTMHGLGHYHESYKKIDGRWVIHTLEQTRLRLDFIRA